MSCGSYLLESMRTELIRSGVLASFLLYERINTYLGISFICELDGFGVFNCCFSGRYNNTFKLVVGHVQYYFSSQSFSLSQMLCCEVVQPKYFFIPCLGL